jgi:hypothetical protein
MHQSMGWTSRGVLLGLVLFGISGVPLHALDPLVTQGVLEVTNLTGLVAEVSDAENKLVRPVADSRYELPVGEYWVRVRPVDDIGWLWTWSAQVHVAEVPVVLAVPDTAKAHTLLWQIEHEKVQIAALQSEYPETRKKQKEGQQTAAWSLAWGGISAAAAGAFFWAGSSQMQSYHNATNQNDAQNLHIQIAVESIAFVVTAVVGVVGLGTGVTVWAITPQTKKLDEQIKAGNARLQALEQPSPPEVSQP